MYAKAARPFAERGAEWSGHRERQFLVLRANSVYHKDKEVKVVVIQGIIKAMNATKDRKASRKLYIKVHPQIVVQFREDCGFSSRLAPGIVFEPICIVQGIFALLGR